MSLPKFTSFMLKNQPDQTAYLLNKLVEGHGGGSGEGKLYDTTGQHTDGAMTQKATTDALGTKANAVDVGNALAGKVDKEVGKGIIPLDDYLTITTDQTATGQKTFANVTKIQSGQGTGSMWIGGNVNSNNLSNNQRHLARVTVPSYSDITLGHTMLGFDSSGDSDMHVANKTYDALSIGGMKKITNASSPMAIGFCVTDTRYATAANKKIYPLEMDANEARFNVKPNYNGTDLALITDIPGQYILPPATSSTLGGIKVGNNLSITSDGTLSASGGTLPSNLVYHDDPGSVTPVTPYVGSSDIIDGSVTTAKLANAAVAENQIDWSTFSPCVSRFMFTGDSMPSPSQDIVKQTLRGTNLTFHISNNAIYISSGADNITKVHYSIAYNHQVVNYNYGIIGLKPDSRIWTYYTGYILSGATNTSNSGTYTDTGAIYGNLISSTGDKDSFHTEFDIIRSVPNANNSKSDVWFIFGTIQSSYNTFAGNIRCECTSTNVGTVPSIFQRSCDGKYYSIIIDVYEE